MKKWLAGVSLGLLFLLGVGFYGVYQFGGWKYYLKAVRQINKLEGEEKALAEKYFYSQPEPDDKTITYGGVLVRVNTKDNGGVWVWGKKGPRYFKADEFSVYSFFEICKPVILEKYKNGEEVKIGQEVFTDIKEWGRRVRQGDYAAIIITDNGYGGTPGNLREAKVNDWWAFLPSSNVEAQCLER